MIVLFVIVRRYSATFATVRLYSAMLVCHDRAKGVHRERDRRVDRGRISVDCRGMGGRKGGERCEGVAGREPTHERNVPGIEMKTRPGKHP